MKRVSENPPVRYPEGLAIADALAPWWVAKLKPRQEKAFAIDCINWDIEYYLPMVTKVTRRKDNNKPRKSVLPLFAGYIAFACTKPDNTRIFSTHRVVNVIGIKHQNRFIRELVQIQQTLDLGIPLEPVQTFETGTYVRVEHGILRGVEGIVVKYQNMTRLILSVDGLGRAATIVDAAAVVPVPDPNEQ